MEAEKDQGFPGVQGEREGGMGEAQGSLRAVKLFCVTLWHGYVSFCICQNPMAFSTQRVNPSRNYGF